MNSGGKKKSVEGGKCDDTVDILKETDVNPQQKKETDSIQPEATAFIFSLNQIPLPCLLANEKGEICVINSSAIELFGKQAAEIPGRNIINFLPDDESGRFNSFLRNIFNGSHGESHEMHVSIGNRKNNFVLTGKEIFSADLSARNCLITFTEKKNNSFAGDEISLVKKMQRLAGIGYWVWDIVNNKLFWSDELFFILGKEPDADGAKELFIQHAHPEDKHIALKSIEDAYNPNVSHVHYFRLIHEDQTDRNVETITETEKDENGKVVRLFGTVRDITGKAESEKEQVAFTKLLNELAAAANMAETVEDAAKNSIIRICEFSDWQIGQLYLAGENKNLYNTGIRYMDPSLNSSNATEFSELFNLNKNTELSERVKKEMKPVWTKDFFLNDNAFTILNAKRYGLKSGFAFPVLLKHEVIGVLEFLSTRVIKDNVQLRHLAAFMGTHLGRVEERKRAREELKIAKEKAEVSEQAKEQFLANISHEIRTPLNGILGFTNLLSDTELTQQQKKYVGTVKHSADNLLDIVNNVLDLSKIKTGKITFEETGVDIRKLVAKAVNTIKPKAKAKKLVVNIKIQKEIPVLVTGDPLRLGQILLNLLSNAVKFTRKGKIDISVKKTSEDTETISLYFEVADTGIGIKKDKLSTIFESFTQASSDTTRKYGGTGLGLTIAKQLVELQNGNIGVKSEINKGSVFFFDLRFKKYLNLRRKTVVKKITGKQVELRFTKVLVVEDNMVNRQLVRRLLENQGMEVHTAINGKVALKKLVQQEFHLVLMDLQMPVMDGFETAKRIRMEMGNTEIPIIAITAHALKGEAEKCLEAGMNDYLSKPINTDELFARINKYVYYEQNKPKEVAVRKTTTEIDLSSLSSMMKGNVGLLREMAGLFIKNTPQLLKKFDTCVETNNFAGLKLYAHKLRSSVKIIGMQQCDEVLRSIEDEINEGTVNAELLTGKIQMIKASCKRAIEELKQELKLD